MPPRGFTLLIAVIFTSVILALAVTLGALGYKQSVLASGAIQSQNAFYAADAALECGLYADQQQDPSPVAYDATASDITCELAQFPLTVCQDQAGCMNERISTVRVDLDNKAHCADLAFYKPKDAGTTYIFSTGYNVSCDTVAAPAGVRFVARGLELHY